MQKSLILSHRSQNGNSQIDVEGTQSERTMDAKIMDTQMRQPPAGATITQIDEVAQINRKIGSNAAHYNETLSERAGSYANQKKPSLFPTGHPQNGHMQPDMDALPAAMHTVPVQQALSSATYSSLQ